MLDNKERNILQIFNPRVKLFGLAITKTLGMPPCLLIQSSIIAKEYNLFPYAESLVSHSYGKSFQRNKALPLWNPACYVLMPIDSAIHL